MLSPEPEWIEIYATGNQGEIGLLKSLLADEQVVFRFQDEFMSFARPFSVPARLMVAKEDVPKAEKIVREMMKGTEEI